ncbi:hypothetical protein Q5H93_15385 [Hymenobacter sp. ASUV-10]|uniref:Uncharacterized protein n=1 Tax=Hymenobacter aranciens TaxID=3063996 RepID=A0ABT9BCX9_9BACT|nr:hypothetical protein [Hymenobacter sp. ASUV-10]MDO7876126.1 hypothetical protein [Hymenobacter sp. ASUV-10]
MPILDNLAKAAKDFFIDDEHSPVPAGATPLPLAAVPAFAPGAPALAQPEQRHLDHIASLLAGDGHDFAAYTKMVRSMAGSGMAGPLLYQTAFNAFAALTGQDLPALLASAEQLTDTLATDRARVQQRHREKLGEAPAPAGPPSAIMELLSQEKQLQADLAELSQQLADKSQLLQTTQQQLHAERQRADASLASYELAHAAALGELQAHRQAAQSFLATNPSTH